MRSHRSLFLFLAAFVLVSFNVSIARAADFMYVTNGGQGPSFISRFDTAGTHFGNIPDTYLNSPAGIAQNSSRQIYVVNNGNNTVSIFDNNFGYLGGIGSTYLGGGAQVATFDQFDNFYVSLRDGKIVKYDSSKKYVMTMTRAGNPNLQGMVIDPQGNLYVANYTSNSIDIFDSVTGQYQSSITGNGLNGPHGIARDGAGYLYVTNATANTISKFNPDRSANSVLNGGGVLSFPIGIGFDQAGDFFVANNSNNTVTKYGPSGNLPLTINSNLAGARWLAFPPYFVPEPSTYALAAIGAGVMGLLARRQRSRKA